MTTIKKFLIVLLPIHVHLLSVVFAGMLILWLSGCSGLKKDAISKHKKQFQIQIEMSCQEGNGKYEKVVQDLSEEQGETEDMILTLTSSEDSTCLLEQELFFAMEYDFQDPNLREYFELEVVNDTLIATRIEGKESAVPLRLQKIVYQSPDSMFKYIYSQIERKNWLYQSAVQTNVSFDSLGIYDHHSLKVSTSVFSISDIFQAGINGRLVQ